MALEWAMDLSKDRPYEMNEWISGEVSRNTLRLFTIFLGSSFKFHSHFYAGTMKPNYLNECACSVTVTFTVWVFYCLSFHSHGPDFIPWQNKPDGREMHGDVTNPHGRTSCKNIYVPLCVCVCVCVCARARARARVYIYIYTHTRIYVSFQFCLMWYFHHTS